MKRLSIASLLAAAVLAGAGPVAAQSASSEAESLDVVHPPDPQSEEVSNGVTFRSFEFRAVSVDPKADGVTDFKGQTATLSTEERIAFLNAYADYAAAWFGDPQLDQLAVQPAEAERRLGQIKPQPLTSVRQTIRLNDNWRQLGVSTSPEKGEDEPWRTRRGVELKDGELVLPRGTTEILDLAQSSGWRYELRWEAKGRQAGQQLQWCFGAVQPAKPSRLTGKGWHCFRFQADLVEKRGYLSEDGERVVEFPLAQPPGQPAPFRAVCGEPFSIRNLVFIDYRARKDVKQPYAPVVLADDDFRTQPSTDNWNTLTYDDARWAPASLPCVHGGFLEAGEDLYLRRIVVLPAARRVWLEVEALDPSGEIYVNGNLAGMIPNRLPILLDVTTLAKEGTNVIAFKVNHNWIEDPTPHAPADRAVGWFAGRTTLYLIPGDVAIRGLLVNTASLDQSGNAKQTHRLALENAGDKPFDGALEIAYRPWFPQTGTTVCVSRVPVLLAAHGSLQVEVDMDLPGAMLWSPENPRLYAVTATLREKSGRGVDDFVTTTGVRTVAQKDGQLLLNGKPALLIGAQVMGLRPYPNSENAAKYNRCAPAELLMSEMLAIKNMGGNLLRLHEHMSLNKTGGINDPRIAEMADQLGLALFWTSPAWIREGDERSVDTANVGAYIRQVYNHPSIINWELSNHPNTFKQDDSQRRTDEFVRRTVDAVLAVDSSRLITPTTYWTHTHYANDLGTLDWKHRPITAVPEYTHPLVTRGSQDALTGYGAEWTVVRQWPKGMAADCLKNHVRPWFNFEHEESAAQPNWNLSGGLPWHHLRSYEASYEKGSIGRVLGFDEWRASQGWQAFSAYESMRRQIWYGVAAFSWCTIEGGANSGTYEKPLLDPMGHAKLAWYVHKLLTQPVFGGSGDVDVVYGPDDTIKPCVFNLGPPRRADLIVSVKTPDGRPVDQRTFADLHLRAGRSLLRLPAWRPSLPSSGYCIVEYTVRIRP